MVTDGERINWARDRLLRAIHRAEKNRGEESYIEAVFARAWEYEEALDAPARTKEIIRREKITAARRAISLKRERAAYLARSKHHGITKPTVVDEGRASAPV